MRLLLLRAPSVNIRDEPLFDSFARRTNSDSDLHSKQEKHGMLLEPCVFTLCFPSRGCHGERAVSRSLLSLLTITSTSTNSLQSQP